MSGTASQWRGLQGAGDCAELNAVLLDFLGKCKVGWRDRLGRVSLILIFKLADLEETTEFRKFSFKALKCFFLSPPSWPWFTSRPTSLSFGPPLPPASHQLGAHS